MNAGMYKEDNSPLGLFIEDKKVISPLNTKSGNEIFILKPKGYFISQRTTLLLFAKPMILLTTGK
jgi:uncharacterized protein YigE (DUF2233 family)